MDVNPADVQKALKGAEYPAEIDELIRQAEANDAPEEVIEALQDLVGTFDGPQDVQEALG